MVDVKAFISYRRSDSEAATGRLYDRLNAAYPGHFFRDVSRMAAGVDFLKEIAPTPGPSDGGDGGTGGGQSNRPDIDGVRPAPAPPPAQGVGFPGRGRWKMTSQANSALSIVLDLQPDSTFQVSVPTGAMSFPFSGGSYDYDASTGMLQIMGINNLGGMFREVIHVFERENDHFHVNYSNAVWELTSE